MAGSEVYTYNLARELAKTNDVFVFHRIEDKDIPLHQFFDSFEEGVHIRKINNYEPTPATFYDKYLNPEIDDAFREYVKKVNPDVVHIGHLSHLSTQIPIIAKREFGLPVFFTIHDFWMFCHRGQLINPQNWEICPLPNVAQCTKCAAFHYQKDDFESKLIEERDEHIRQTLDCVDMFFAPSHTPSILRSFIPKLHLVLPAGLSTPRESTFFAKRLKRLKGTPSCSFMAITKAITAKD